MSLSAQRPGEASEDPLGDVSTAELAGAATAAEAERDVEDRDHDSADQPPDVAPAADDRAPAPTEHRGLPGSFVVTVATSLVVAAAVAEVQFEERIGVWAGVTLIAVSVIAPLITRSGDRSLPAMMPPLAFLTAVLIAGQDLLPQSDNSPLTRQAVMIVQTLGPNALWVIVATALSVTIATVGHLVDRRAAKRRSR